MRRVFFVTVLWLLMTFEGSAKFIDLHHYCVEQQPDYGHIEIGRITFKDIVRMCSDIEKYLRCIMSPRKGQNIFNYRVKSYEKLFPPEYDIERATYVYCDYLSDKGLEMYQITETITTNCEHGANLSQCDSETKWDKDISNLETDLKENNTYQIFLRSCKIMSGIVRCQMEKYIPCDKRFEYFFHYNTARLGGTCLMLSGIFNPLIMRQTCTYQSTGGASRREFAGTTSTTSWLLLCVVLTLVYLCCSS
ncbi:unnamed protein product [Lymnaea stagnalis]|uniref:Uncharacterized protein n=1 Tax=Lymnaea stagnalis TaxID=6523 RepID=A0AAV2IIK7_LYMST